MQGLLSSDQPVAGSSIGPEQPKHSNVFVRGLPLHLTQTDLQSLLAQYGGVKSCRLVVDLRTSTSKGYGFVNMQSVAEAEAAIAALNGSVLYDRALEVRLADAEPNTNQDGAQPSNNLYIRNLPLTFRDSELASLFSPYGTVLEKRILPLVEGARGAGALVRMASEDEAARAIEGLHNRLPFGATLPLLIRYADTPEEKARKQAKRDRSGAPVQHGQPGPMGYGSSYGPGSGASMQQMPGGQNTMQQQQQQQQPYNGSYMHSQPMQGAMPSQVPMQQGYVQPQQPIAAQQQQQPSVMTNGQPGVQVPGYYASGDPSAMPGFQPQPSSSDFHQANGIPGIGQSSRPDHMGGQMGLVGYGAPGMAAGSAMNGQMMGQGPAGPASGPGMNGSFMPAASPAGSHSSYMAAANPPRPSGAPFVQGYGPHNPSMGPMGMAGPDMHSQPFMGQGGAQQSSGGTSSLYVKNLPQETDKLYMYEKFAPHGAILGIKLMMAPDTGKCKGVGFVNYATADGAMSAISALHGMKVGDRQLHVSLQLHRGPKA